MKGETLTSLWLTKGYEKQIITSNEFKNSR